MEPPFRKATVLLHQTTAAVMKPSGCSVRHRSCTLKSSCPTDPPLESMWSPTNLHPSHTHTHLKQIRVEQNRVTHQSGERLRLPCFIPTHRRMPHVSRAHTDTHAHTHTRHAWSQRECRRGERGGVRQHAKRRMSKNHWDLNLEEMQRQIWGIDGVTGLTAVCAGTEGVFWNQIGSGEASEWVKRGKERECKNVLCIITSAFSVHGELTAKQGLM